MRYASAVLTPSPLQRASALLDVAFDRSAEAAAPNIRRAWLGALYVLGAITWLYILGWGRAPLDFNDWADINVPRLSMMREAVITGAWPLHAANTHSLHGVTDRILTLPDVITTPQMVLLPWLGVTGFILFDLLLHYSLGFLGLLALRRRCQWSLFAFTVVFALFSFNGHIVIHYSIGHFTWAAYFLFPACIALAMALCDGEAGWRWVARFAALMGYAVLAGGQHHFTWVVMFFACLMPFVGRRAVWIAAAVVASGLLSAVRLLPPVLSLDAFRAAPWINDVIGYPSVWHVLTSMVELRRENLAAVNWNVPGNFVFYEINYSEYSYYVGAVGALAILYFGVYRWLTDRAPVYRELMAPTLILTALSIGTVFRLVRATGMPLIMSERLVSRMLSLPMTVFIVIAGVMIDRVFSHARPSRWNRLAAIGLLGLLAVDLAGGARLLRVSESARVMKPVAAAEIADRGRLAHRDDPIYARTIAGGALITIATGAALARLASRDRRAAARRAA